MQNPLKRVEDSSQLTRYYSDRVFYYLFCFTLRYAYYFPVQTSTLPFSVFCSISALSKQEARQHPCFPENGTETQHKENEGNHGYGAQSCKFHTEYLSCPFNVSQKCSIAVETQAFNNALHLRNFSKINIDDKMQSFTLKKKFLNAPEVCKY